MSTIEEARAFVLAHPHLMLGAALDTVAELLVKFGDETHFPMGDADVERIMSSNLKGLLAA